MPLTSPQKLLAVVGISLVALAGSATASLAQGDYWFPRGAHFYYLYTNYYTCVDDYRSAGKECDSLGRYCNVDYYGPPQSISAAHSNWRGGDDVVIHENWGSEELACRVSPK